MSFSVVIPTVLRSGSVARCVGSILASAARTGESHEVLLVVNGAGGAAPPRLDSPRLRVLTPAVRGVSAARNAGVAAARHDTILFSDDDLIVAPGWCAALVTALREPGVGAVAAPVRMVVRGPVTAFMDHERWFDALPLDGTRARAVVTANAGYRRDLLEGAPFDVANHPDHAEDTDLGLRIRAGGRHIAWLGGTAPSMHEVTEHPAAMIRRAVQQGIGSAELYLRSGALDVYMPAALHGYRRALGRAGGDGRRYLEIVPAPVRRTFAALGAIRFAAALAGYLDAAGRILGVELIRFDADRATELLVRGFEQVTAADRAAVGDGWSTFPVDFTAPGKRGSERPGGMHDLLRAVLREAAPLAVDEGDGSVASSVRPGTRLRRVPRRLHEGDLDWFRWHAERAERLEPALRQLPAGSPTLSDVERAARSVGFPLSTGCHLWERRFLPPS